MTLEPIEIHVIADSTGDTAARVARAAMSQFTGHPIHMVKHPRIITAVGLADVFDRIAAALPTRMTVFSTLVDEGLRELVDQRCTELDIPHCDLLSPALDALERASGDRAERVPARPVGIDSDYFQRIAAMEFAVKHDDGQHLEGLRNADIVLMGISRTGKTPLSMYLGYLGYRTANVPLVAGIAPPAALFEVDRFRVVALTIDPNRLATIRSRRVTLIAPVGEISAYAELTAIFDEIDHAQKIQRTIGCPVIDTTTLALEEAARRVIELVDSRRPTRPSI
ncbi:MAG: pyruvate, water dikinase regulatory protein [Nakamurella sp.]